MIIREPVGKPTVTEATSEGAGKPSQETARQNSWALWRVESNQQGHIYPLSLPSCAHPLKRWELGFCDSWLKKPSSQGHRDETQQGTQAHPGKGQVLHAYPSAPESYILRGNLCLQWSLPCVTVGTRSIPLHPKVGYKEAGSASRDGFML